MFERLKSLFCRKKSKTDEEFFVDLISTDDWWNIRHYGNCLRFSNSGYCLNVGDQVKDNKLLVIFKLIGKHKETVFSVEGTSEEVEENVKVSRDFLLQVFKYLEEKDPFALERWVYQLKSSVSISKWAADRIRVVK